MEAYNHVALRDARKSMSVSLARVAREARLSVGHLSRFESGKRDISPAIVNGYERALGLRLSPSHLTAGSLSDTVNGYRHGEDADDMKRRAFTAAVAAIAAGAPLGEPVNRALASLGSSEAPTHVGLSDVVQVEEAADMFTSWDLRFGGGLAREMAKAQLRWATGLLDAHMNDPIRARLNSAVGSLAERAAWSTFDSGRQEAARTLFKLALYAATEADDADLRAHILSDVATQQMYLGHPDECLKIIRLAEGDDRISPAVRFVLHGVKARAFGIMADKDACERQIGLAEDAYATVTEVNTPEWMRKFLNEAHVYSVTGQAAFSLARATGTFNPDAHDRLTRAIAGFDGGRARAVALCSTRLAMLHLDSGNAYEGERAARTALRAVTGLRSARIVNDLHAMRTAANRPVANRTTSDLSEEISVAISAAT